MRVIETRSAMSLLCQSSKRPLGLVPTMGYLHQGHLSLVQNAIENNATVAVSIFVNPTQFGPQEDLDSYPRDLSRDLSELENMGVDIVFVPSQHEMYPFGFDTWVEPYHLAQRLEGEFRPGHFKGVSTVIVKLLNIMKPNKAYFGQKDGQQAIVIRRLVTDLDIGTEVVVLPTIRDVDGLAYSSRNAYLGPQERAAALIIHKGLSAAKDRWRSGERKAEALIAELSRTIDSEPLASRLDYISIADADTLEELRIIDRRAMLSVALYIGEVRLIDNVLLE